MKRLLFLFAAAIVASLSANAQLSGDGSKLKPYHGTLIGDFTISGTKYFDGSIIADNEKLTLAAGTILIPTSSKANIIINGTGQIDALGTALSRIFITADPEITGDPDVSTSIWGGISVLSSGVSRINHCVLEGCQKIEGGGLRISTSSVTVSHCVIVNCMARYGGAISVTGGSSPVISNCALTDNVAFYQGGGIFVTAGSSPVFSNIILNNNNSLSATLKGGSIASIGSSPSIVNSTIVYSNSRAPEGKSVYLENSPGARIINTIMWGRSAHVGLSGTPSSVINFCAIEGASLAGCINLNSSNTAPDGPNFTDPVSGDFNLRFESPCRDTGADSYTGVTIPPADYAGRGRIHVTDMGIYEMIYSRWTGNNDSDWAKLLNWDEGYVPGSRNIIIPAGTPNYPVMSPGPSFALNSGLKMIMEPGARATFQSLTNNGTIEVHADATDMASLMTNSYSGAGGSMNVDVYLTAATEEIDRWHYIAAPATVSKTVFTDIEPENLLNYDESKVIDDVIQGWQWHDGYDGTTQFSTLEAKKGYDVLVFSDTTMVFSGLKSMTTSMGQVNLPFSGSGSDTSLYGYSLVGNSLTCGMNWDLVTRSDPNYVRNGIYWISNGIDVSYVNGVGTNGGSAHIPPLQGFFVKTRATGTYITIPDNAREHNSTARYKSARIIPVIRLTLVSAGSEDETVIRLESAATEGFDGELDASKIYGPKNRRALLYSVMNGENYSINSIPWPATKTVIPLTLEIPEAGSYKIRRTQLQGLGNSKVNLTDNTTGRSVDLNAFSDYAFDAPEGTIAGRFTVTVSADIAEVKKQEEITGSLRIYSSQGKVCVLPCGGEWDNTIGKVNIFDITGRVIMSDGEERFNPGELKEYSPSGARGMLIIEVTAGDKRYLEKVVVTGE